MCSADPHGRSGGTGEVLEFVFNPARIREALPQSHNKPKATTSPKVDCAITPPPAYPRPSKVVISSNFTSTLDILGDLAERHRWGFLRLDGGTPTGVRQSLVDRFNRASSADLFAFLLSAKAGGVGLNL